MVCLLLERRVRLRVLIDLVSPQSVGCMFAALGSDRALSVSLRDGYGRGSIHVGKWWWWYTYVS